MVEQLRLKLLELKGLINKSESDNDGTPVQVIEEAKHKLNEFTNTANLFEVKEKIFDPYPPEQFYKIFPKMYALQLIHMVYILGLMYVLKAINRDINWKSGLVAIPLIGYGLFSIITKCMLTSKVLEPFEALNTVKKWSMIYYYVLFGLNTFSIVFKYKYLKPYHFYIIEGLVIMILINLSFILIILLEKNNYDDCSIIFVPPLLVLGTFLVICLAIKKNFSDKYVRDVFFGGLAWLYLYKYINMYYLNHRKRLRYYYPYYGGCYFFIMAGTFICYLTYGVLCMIVKILNYICSIFGKGDEKTEECADKGIGAINKLILPDLKNRPEIYTMYDFI